TRPAIWIYADGAQPRRADRPRGLGRQNRCRRRRASADGGHLVSVFARLAPRLQQAIVARLGWSSLRPVQELAGEALLSGKNAVILAPTAGGKTEAATFPTISQLVDRQAAGVGAIYIAP